MGKTVDSRLGRRLSGRDALIGSNPRAIRRRGVHVRPRATAARSCPICAHVVVSAPSHATLWSIALGATGAPASALLPHWDLMAVDLTLNLPPDTSAPGLARTATKRSLAGELSPERLSELSLVITELVTNALLHGRGQVVFRLQLDDGIVRGEVIDQGGGFEHEIRARGADEVGGRGLFLVEALTNSWGIHEGTTHVWFELAAQTDSSGPLGPRLGQDERPEALD
jgi:anti-sigma regulatory factor (Ser/Thr protein kinase)